MGVLERVRESEEARTRQVVIRKREKGKEQDCGKKTYNYESVALGKEVLPTQAQNKV